MIARINKHVLILIILFFSAFLNAEKITRTLISGKIQETYIKPLYGYMISPTNLEDRAGHKAGADFLCLYLAGKGYNQDGQMYVESRDPWNRQAFTFPTNLIFLTSVLVKYFDFPSLLLINLYFQFFFFLFVSYYYLKKYNLGFSLNLYSLGIISFLTFCTPVGLAWFERGQTDLFTGIAFLFFLKGIRDEVWWDFLLAGIFLSFKWSGIPYFTFFTIVYLFTNKLSLNRLMLLFLAAFPTFVFLIPFWDNSLFYLKEIRRFELLNYPDGISLTRHFPRLIAKILPFIQVILYGINLRLNKLTELQKVRLEYSFILLLSYVCCAYGTYSFEYRVVALLALVPFYFSQQLIFSRNAFSIKDPVIKWFSFFFIFYIFKFESQFEILNSILDYKRGRIIFNLLNIILIFGIYHQMKKLTKTKI